MSTSSSDDDRFLDPLAETMELVAEHGAAVVALTIDENGQARTAETKVAMKKALLRIQTGEYAKAFILENRAGAPTLTARRRLTAEHPIEVVGEKLRAMMPWIKANRLVDRSRN
jgi:ketol-acid reductoisomerase